MSPRRTPVPELPPFESDEAADREAPQPIRIEDVPEETLGFAPKSPEEPRVSLVPINEYQADHVITGLGMLAKMSDAEFTAKMEMLRKGRERVAQIQKTLMVEGTDYGKVKGIDRPFLHLPGAEALEKFYGYVAEQRVVRIDGTYVEGVGWTSPPYGYRTDTIVHLGDLNGPVVAMVSGSCNVWESRYRYRTAKATCPTCGREGLIRGKRESRLAGKWWCPGREGGCNSTFEPNATKPDGALLVEPPGKVENTDFYDLDETIIQISQKRSYVAGIRRATGTSGLFTIDDDSPSVRDQSAQSGETDAAAPVVEAATIGIPIAPGGRTTQATAVQHDRLKVLAKDKGLGGAKIAELLERLFGTEIEPTGAAASAAVRTLDADQMGALLALIEFGDLPSGD